MPQSKVPLDCMSRLWPRVSPQTIVTPLTCFRAMKPGALNTT